MPKLVPVITDWSEEDRIGLVRKWHPPEVYDVTFHSINMGANDQLAVYKVVANKTVCNEKHDVTKGNTYFYNLKVEDCIKHLGPRG